MVKIHGYTRERGRCWKFCPYSTNYFNKYYNNGFAGPTTNPDIDQTNFTSVVTSDHLYTNGTMNMHTSRGVPGWMCFDDDCQYLIDNGVRYFEL
jgi:hypothetical protein